MAEGDEICWEYIDENGNVAFTAWYDADTHFIELPPGKLIVMKRDTGGGCALTTLALLSIPFGLITSLAAYFL